MSHPTHKKIADLPHGYELYQLNYTQADRDVLETGDASCSLDGSRLDARHRDYRKVDARDVKPLRQLTGDTKSFTQ